MSWENEFSFREGLYDYDLYVRYYRGMTEMVPPGIVPTSTSNMRMATPTIVPTSTRNVYRRPASTLTRNQQVSTSTPEIVQISTSGIVQTSTRNVQRSTSTPEIGSMSTSTSVYSLYGRPPASRWTVENLPRVLIMENEGACVICLKEWRKRDVAAELPCKHKYHFECVKKWLEIHATCPQCRYEMPLEGEEDFKNVEVEVDDDDDDDEDYDYSDYYDSDSDE